MIVAAALGFAMIPTRAEPCSPCIGSDVEVLGDPSDVPSNVLMITTVPDDLDVTIDGDPAAVVTVPFSWWPQAQPGYVPVRLDPIPPGGNVVELDFPVEQLCLGDAVPPVGVVVGPPDLEPPAPPTGITVDVHHYALDMAQCDPSQSTYWVHLDPVPGSHQGEVVRVALVEDGTILGGGHYDLDPGGPLTTIGLRDIWGADPALTCVRVSTMDAAGNETGYAELCDPCHVHTDPPGIIHLDPPAEPAWTDDDLWPGGDCVGVDAPPEPEDDPGSSDTGGSDGGDQTSGTSAGADETAGPLDSGPADGTGAGGTGVGGTLGSAGDGSTSFGSGGGTGGSATDREDGCACRSTSGRTRPGWAVSLILLPWARRRRAPATTARPSRAT